MALSWEAEYYTKNAYHIRRRSMNSKKVGLVVVFPGTGYTCKEQLFSECIEPLLANGYECIKLDFSSIPFKQIESIDEAFERTKPVVINQLRHVLFSEYAHIVFLAKSFGTGLASWYGSLMKIYPQYFFLTPTDKGLELNCSQSQIAGIVIGTEDKVLDYQIARNFCKLYSIPNLIIEGIGHKLKTEDTLNNAHLNKTIVSFMVNALAL